MNINLDLQRKAERYEILIRLKL